jgi:hypothetical protein
MMPWVIDRLSFDAVDRSLVEAEPVDHEIVRTGADGTAFQIDAYRAASQEIVATVQVDSGRATSFRSSCKSLETRVVTVIDQHGWNWTVYVRRCRVTWHQQINNRYLIRAAFLLVPRAIRP